MRTFGWICAGLFLVSGLFFLTCQIFTSPARVASRMIQNGENTVVQQFSPSELLRKYEWFKDASAGLDKKQADIHVYDARQKSLEAAYVGQPRSAWAREDRQQLAIWMSEVAGIKASYNSLAAEYNAQMVKFNWRFANRGMLPQGATEPLPREYKPYVEN